MILPQKTVMLRVDYGEPSWRVPLDGETADARIIADALLAMADMLDAKP